MMSEDEFGKRRQLFDGINRIGKESISSYNDTHRNLSKGLLTSSTTFITIVLAFANNVKDFFGPYAWIIVVSVILFTVSLLTWIIEQVVISIDASRTIQMSRYFEDVIIEGIKDIASVEKIAEKVFSGRRTSLIPIVLQVVFFIMGILFAVTAIMIALLG